MEAKTFLAAAAVLTVALAGCVGNFDVKQTEPLRIKLEGDGTGSSGSTSATTIHLDEKTTSRTITVEKKAETEKMVLVVNIRAAGSSSTTSSGSNTGAGTNTTTGTNTTMDGNTTSGNTTASGNATTGGTSQTTVNVVIINIVVTAANGEKLGETQVQAPPGGTATGNLAVNVKGKDNVVIVTQAVQGAADVDVNAQPG